jgi:catechol 2,3-dioxygenase-like lactoylglutathione lyase family enzyme
VFSHVCVSVGDFARAFDFYSALMGTLKIEPRFCEPDKPWAGWHSQGGVRPYFLICHPHDGHPHEPGHGQMVAFMADSHAMVRSAHQTALSHGGTCEGPPGLRPQYHADYYGAYFRDPDGNKLCVVCHAPEAITCPSHPSDPSPG